MITLQIYVVTDEDEGDVWINEVEDSGIHIEDLRVYTML